MKKYTDLTGRRVGMLTVIKRFPSTEKVKWECLCDCGTTKVIVHNHLLQEETKSCGCLRRKTSSEKATKDLTGQRFGRLVALKIVRKSRSNYWLCDCDCGKQTVVRCAHLLNGATQSCGCLQRDRTQKPDSSINRCYLSYKQGATNRGLSFELTKQQFIIIATKNCHYCDSAPTNKKITASGIFIYNGIDRVDNNKGYSIDNVVPCCRICNRAKRELSVEDFLEWIGKLIDKWS